MFWQYADSCSAYTLGKNYPNIKLKGLLHSLQLCWRYLPPFYKFLNLLYCSVFTVYNSLFTLTLIKIDNVTRFFTSGNCRRSNLSEILSNRLYCIFWETSAILIRHSDIWENSAVCMIPRSQIMLCACCRGAKLCCVHDTSESNYAMCMLPWSQTLLCPCYRGVKFCYVQCACYRGAKLCCVHDTAESELKTMKISCWF